MRVECYLNKEPLCQQCRLNNWAELKTACEAGEIVTLSKTFVAGAYPGEIRIRHGGTCVFRGKGQVLDARNAGRLFSVSHGSSLEIHGFVLKNGQEQWGDVSLSPFHFCFGSIRCKKEMTFSLYARARHMERLGRRGNQCCWGGCQDL
jgi:hypothetical protein